MAYSKEIGLMNFYKLYKEISIKKGLPYKDYKKFRDTIKIFNTKLRDKIVYESERVILPRKLGELYVAKYENFFDMNKKTRRLINFKETKEKGYTVYFEEQYGYKWKWYKKTCIVSGKRYYQFKACRAASKCITNAIKIKKIDYYN